MRDLNAAIDAAKSSADTALAPPGSVLCPLPRGECWLGPWETRKLSCGCPPGHGQPAGPMCSPSTRDLSGGREGRELFWQEQRVVSLPACCWPGGGGAPVSSERGLTSLPGPSDEVSLEESEDDARGARCSSGGPGQHRASTAMHVCWDRTASISRADRSAAVEVRPPETLLVWADGAPGVHSGGGGGEQPGWAGPGGRRQELFLKGLSPRDPGMAASLTGSGLFAPRPPLPPLVLSFCRSRGRDQQSGRGAQGGS